MHRFLALLLGPFLLVGCSPVPSDTVQLIQPVQKSLAAENPAVKAAAEAGLAFDNESSYYVDFSVMCGSRISGDFRAGKREDLQPGPSKTVSKSTITPYAQGLTKYLDGDLPRQMDALVVSLRAAKVEDGPDETTMAFVLPRSWFEGKNPGNIGVRIDDKGASLTLGGRHQRLEWQRE